MQKKIDIKIKTHTKKIEISHSKWSQKVILTLDIWVSKDAFVFIIYDKVAKNKRFNSFFCHFQTKQVE